MNRSFISNTYKQDEQNRCNIDILIVGAIVLHCLRQPGAEIETKICYKYAECITDIRGKTQVEVRSSCAFAVTLTHGDHDIHRISPRKFTEQGFW